MATTTCYRHPDRETGVCLLALRAPDLPRLHDPDVGRDALPRVRRRQHQGPDADVRGLGDARWRGRRCPDRDQRRRVPVRDPDAAAAGSASSGSTVFADGALCGNAIGDGGFCAATDLGLVIETDGGEWWRILTAGFLHGSLIHLALNMFALYILGQVLEPAIGTARFVAVYLRLADRGLGRGAADERPQQFTVGASGAVYGLFLATIIIARQRGMTRSSCQLGFWLVLNLVFTFSVPNISIGGHLGGIVGGAIGALLVVGAERRIAAARDAPGRARDARRRSASPASSPRSSIAAPARAI